jgi:uncharacterized protein YjbI with pentapeptide repeats
MSNPEHLRILQRGVDVWNRWREVKPDVKPDLCGADLSRQNLMHIDFRSTELRFANFSYANLTGALMRLSNLRYALLNTANLIGTDLHGADLSGADIVNARIYDSYLAGADLLDAKMGWTIIGNVDLSAVQNLNSVKHAGPSSVGLDTIYKSGGNISEQFLRRCGVTEDFITYMHSLVGQAIEFSSCFVSYSSKDEEFARRLYADLQSEGVRCWFAPEDLKIGDRYRVRIDESIRSYDKLLLVLSENSVASQWVEKEVETAFDKEGEQGKIVLFPVRLDDAVLEAKTGWAADVRRSRHVGDFRDWKNHDSYRKAFERLMRDLKAEAGR